MSLAVGLLAALFTSVPASGQLLVGPWISESEQATDKARKTDLRVIVMDHHGLPAAGARVRIEQTRSSFQLGLILPETGWPEQGLGADTHTEFWRCFNSISLERLTDWPSLQTEPGAGLDAGRVALIEAALDHAEANGMFVRWGPVVSADPGRVPDWAVGLDGEALSRGVADYCGKIHERFGSRIDQFDVYTQTLSHSFIEDRAGVSVVRGMYSSVPVHGGGAQACARFDDAMDIQQMIKVQRRLTAMREAFIPVQVVALDHTFGGTLERRALVRLLSKIDQIKGPVVVSGLTVGGDSEVTAAINLETVLRTLMERPGLQGIWFAGLNAELAGDPSGALLDDMGLPTPSGRVVDSLYHGNWREDIEASADELGNVRSRVFPGDYRVTATLADGTACTAEVHVVKSVDPKVVLIEPMRPGMPMEVQAN